METLYINRWVGIYAHFFPKIYCLVLQGSAEETAAEAEYQIEYRTDNRSAILEKDSLFRFWVFSRNVFNIGKICGGFLHGLISSTQSLSELLALQRVHHEPMHTQQRKNTAGFLIPLRTIRQYQRPLGVQEIVEIQSIDRHTTNYFP